MIDRALKPLNNKSFFLFGARATGKTSFLRQHYIGQNSLYLDLLDAELIDQLRLDPARFLRIVTAPEHSGKTIIVDEVQKLPEILDAVQQLISKDNRTFILTGSSARRLKQAGTNLLAGRALVYNLFPLSSVELKESFNLDRALTYGLLPDVYLAESDELAQEILKAYVLTYVEKEIQLEQWVRKLEPFRKFLMIAAQMSGKIINRAKIARDVGVDDMTIASYYEILEDTLLGITLPAFHRSIRKSQRTSPKFYLIDTGIKRAIEKQISLPLMPGTSSYGEAFEQFIFMEIVKLASYARKEWSLSYYQTKEGHEIDLVIERPGQPLLLIEIKSKTTVREEDSKTILRLGAEIDKNAEMLILSQDQESQNFNSARAVHWRKGLSELF